ncbi:MAG: zinc transporter ZupT [Rikenellaceae bacterium]
MEPRNIILALAITLFAGLATGIGSAIAFVAHRMSRSAISFALGLSAGVMLYISFVELFVEAQEVLCEAYGGQVGNIAATISLFAGIALIWLIDLLVPDYENPHELHKVSPNKVGISSHKRIGVMTALAIAIHNFPEGISTFITAIESPSLGLAIGVAIALHNIPEGIAVSVPIYQATGSRKKAFWYSFLSGLSEPLGAIIAYLFLAPYLNGTLMGVILAAVAGVMIYVAIDELLPSSRSYGKHNAAMCGVVIGMVIMAATLLFMG